MTKAQEIAALAKFIQSLPADTYLRPWLTEVKNEVDRCITSDFFPDVSLEATSIRMKVLLEEAGTSATRIKENARFHCEAIIRHQKIVAESIDKSASANAEAIRREIRDDVHRLRTVLRDVA
jgi:hypothetical protein